MGFDHQAAGSGLPSGVIRDGIRDQEKVARRPLEELAHHIASKVPDIISVVHGSGDDEIKIFARGRIDEGVRRRVPRAPVNVHLFAAELGECIVEFSHLFVRPLARMEHAEPGTKFARDPVGLRDHRTESRGEGGGNGEVGFRHALGENFARILSGFQRKNGLSKDL